MNITPIDSTFSIQPQVVDVVTCGEVYVGEFVNRIGMISLFGLVFVWIRVLQLIEYSRNYEKSLLDYTYMKKYVWDWFLCFGYITFVLLTLYDLRGLV